MADVNASKTITGYNNVQGTVVGGLTGQTVTMVGAASGKVTGTITATCVNFSYSTPEHTAPVWVLCMQRASYPANTGDSGAPVFIPYSAGNPSSTPAMVGIHNAHDGSGNRYFTPMSQIDLAFNYEFFYQ